MRKRTIDAVLAIASFVGLLYIGYLMLMVR